MISPDHKHSVGSKALWAQSRAPEVTSENPEAFLAFLESRFHEARITEQLSCYHKLLSAIPRDMLINFRDIYMNIPARNPYDVLKEAILRRMAVSEEKRIQLLLSGIQLGNLKPSQLLRQMRALVGNTTIDDSVLRQIWLQRLPEQTQHFQPSLANIGSPEPNFVHQ
ncbi:unnamed protein product [Echinostoma caproni]|uniref:DUF7041 domain-containing protein n=1 Tax=Echinostoma caproni TaxID=27848 RepID=A0A183BGG5_9TREM|nr:unnamed protein product [Echinostoma caproni]